MKLAEEHFKLINLCLGIWTEDFKSCWVVVLLIVVLQ